MKDKIKKLIMPQTCASDECGGCSIIKSCPIDKLVDKILKLFTISEEKVAGIIDKNGMLIYEDPMSNHTHTINIIELAKAIKKGDIWLI